MKKGYQKRIYAVMIAVLFVCCVGSIALRGEKKTKTKLDDSAKKWTMEQTDVQTGIKIPGYSTVYFEAGEEKQKITLYNPEENKCYFQFTLYIDEEDKARYQSDLVEPGMAVQEITLTKAISAGDYTLHIRIDTVDIETGKALNSAVSSANLTVS